MSIKSMTGRTFITGHIAMSAVMLAIFVAMVAMALTFPAKSGLLPLVIGIPGSLMALAQLVMEIGSSRGSDREAAEDTEQTFTQPETSPDLEQNQSGQLRREAMLIGFLFLLVASHLLLGFWIASPLFVALFLVYERESWSTVVISTVGTWVTLYIIFNQLLTVDVFDGFLTAYVMDLFE